MLTDLKVKTAPFKEKAYKLYDSHGLYVLVTPTKAKLWKFKYKFQGKEKLMAFGPYPVVTLGKARDCHLEARRALKEGLDPMEPKKSLEGPKNAVEWPFKRLAKDWLAHWRKGKDPGYVVRVEQRLEDDILPRIGERSVTELTSPDIVAVLREIEARQAVHTAHRCLQIMSQVFRFGVAPGICPFNPATAFRPRDVLALVKSENHKRVSELALPKLLVAIDEYKSPVVRYAMKMMAMSFVRTSELVSAEWHEIDFKACRWNIPKEKMKGKKSPHIVPLSSQAIEILKRLWVIRQEGCAWIFPGAKDGTHIGRAALRYALCSMGYKGTMTGHGFRGVASTILHERNYNHEHIELQLAHGPRDQVSAAYNYARYLPQRAKLMQEWADYLEEARRIIAVPKAPISLDGPDVSSISPIQ